jgi:hypothetical protein
VLATWPWPVQRKRLKIPMEPFEAYLTAYSFLRTQSSDPLEKMGKELYDAKKLYWSWKSLRAIYNQVKTPMMPSPRSATDQSKQKRWSLDFLKGSYSKKKNGEVAFFIAVILAKKTQSDPSVVNEAIR